MLYFFYLRCIYLILHIRRRYIMMNRTTTKSPIIFFYFTKYIRVGSIYGTVHKHRKKNDEFYYFINI